MKKADRMVIELGSGLLLVSLAVNALVSFWSLETLGDRARSVHRSREALEAIERTFNLFKDAELSRRGYLVTGDESTLDAYVVALPLFEASLDRLASLTGHEPDRRFRIEELRREAASRLEGLDPSAKPPRKDATAHVERLNRTMREAELHLLRTHTDGYKAALNRAFATLGIAVFLTIGLAVCLLLVTNDIALAFLGTGLASAREGLPADPNSPLPLPGE